MTAVITPQTVISYQTREGGTTMYPIYTEPMASERDRSLRATEQYELRRALRVADEIKRAERKAKRKDRTRHYLRLVLRRTA